MSSLVVLIVCLALVAGACWLWWRFVIRSLWLKGQEKRSARDRRRSLGEHPRSCPVCGAELLPGELVRSAVYPGAKERLTHVFGCPYCYCDSPSRDRVCPVCAQVLPRGGYLVARMFEKPGRKHVHVLGCSICRKA
jgi:hypothetical protein